MKNLKALSKAAAVAQKEFEDGILENTISEITTLSKKECSDEVSFLMKLLLKHKKIWKVKTEKSGIFLEIELKNLPAAAKKARQLKSAAYEIFKRSLSQFCDERFAKFTITYEIGRKMQIAYSQHSGYGEHAELGAKLELSKQSSKVIRIEHMVSDANEFYCTDPYIERFEINTSTKIIDWMMLGWK